MTRVLVTTRVQARGELPLLGRRTIERLFARRHESPEMRVLARAAIRDARFWLWMTRPS